MVCTDVKPYLREELFPNFKGDRKKAYDDEFDFYAALKQSQNQLSELFDLMNIPVWGVKGLEADDLIACVVQKNNSYNTIVIKSNDSDLNQLLDHSNVIINKKNKFSSRLDEYTFGSFKKEFPKLEPSDWVEYTALVGTHNGIPGIKGIGPKTAEKLLMGQADYEAVKDNYKTELEQKWKLIRLPFPEYTDNIRIMTPGKPSGDYRKLVSFLSSLGITFTNSMRETLEDFI